MTGADPHARRWPTTHGLDPSLLSVDSMTGPCSWGFGQATTRGHRRRTVAARVHRQGLATWRFQAQSDPTMLLPSDLPLFLDNQNASTRRSSVLYCGRPGTRLHLISTRPPATDRPSLSIAQSTEYAGLQSRRATCRLCVASGARVGCRLLAGPTRRRRRAAAANREPDSQWQHALRAPTARGSTIDTSLSSHSSRSRIRLRSRLDLVDVRNGESRPLVGPSVGAHGNSAQGVRIATAFLGASSVHAVTTAGPLGPPSDRDRPDHRVCSPRRLPPRRAEVPWPPGVRTSRPSSPARYDALLRTAYLLTGDHHDAEDLLQQALVKAVGAWGRITGDPEPYVRTILVRQNVSRWRGRRWREVHTAEPPGGRRQRRRRRRPDRPAPGPGPAGAAAAGGDRAALLRGPHRGTDGRGARDRRGHGEVADPGRAAAAARGRARTVRGPRFALIAPVGWLRFLGADRHQATASREPRHQAHHPRPRGGRGGARGVLRAQADHRAERTPRAATRATTSRRSRRRKTFDYVGAAAHHRPGDLHRDAAGRWPARPGVGGLRRLHRSRCATRTPSTPSSTAPSGSPTVRAPRPPTSRRSRPRSARSRTRRRSCRRTPACPRPWWSPSGTPSSTSTGASDPRLQTFLDFYGDGHTAPEAAMASCAGGTQILASPDTP